MTTAWLLISIVGAFGSSASLERTSARLDAHESSSTAHACGAAAGAPVGCVRYGVLKVASQQCIVARLCQFGCSMHVAQTRIVALLPCRTAR